MESYGLPDILLIKKEKFVIVMNANKKDVHLHLSLQKLQTLRTMKIRRT